MAAVACTDSSLSMESRTISVSTGFNSEWAATKALLEPDQLLTSGTEVMFYGMATDNTTSSAVDIIGHTSSGDGTTKLNTGQTIRFDGTKWAYTSGEAYQWKANADHRFFCWLTKDAVSSLTASGFFGTGLSFNSSTGVLSIPSKTMTITDGSLDFAYSDVVTRKASEADYSTVELALKHLFTSFCVSAHNYTSSPVVIKSVKLFGIRNRKSATVTFGTDSSSVVYSEGSTVYGGSDTYFELVSEASGISLATDAEKANIISGASDQKKYILMWPQTAEELTAESSSTTDLSQTINTKALDENTEIESMHVAVFDSTGSKLSQYVLADPFTAATANDTDYQYTVELKTSDKPCILHFIANGPEELRFGSEVEVIGELYKTGGESAYWQRIVLPNITAKPETGDDNYDDKLASYLAVVDSLDGVKLLRNYSKITVEETCDNFALDGFWFVNYPDGGSIAPYNRNTGKFMDDYLDYPTMESLEGPSDSTYTFNSGEPDEFSLAGGNYQGFMNASTSFIAHETFDNASLHALNDDNQCVGYVYEREKVLFSPMYLIVKGTFTEVGKSPATTYYKIALQDAEGDFYAMLRNFDYLVQIQSVASAGYNSAADALAGAPSGDISVNVDYQDLTNISDGDSRMTVSETTLMIIGTPGETATAEFWYKFEPDITGIRYSGAYNGTTEDPTNHTPYVTVSYEGTSGSTGDVISSISIGTDDSKGNRHVTINTTAVGEMLKTQSIIITGKRWNGSRYQTITRTISLVLRNNLDLMVSAAPNTDADGKGYVEAGTGKKVVINLGIEGGLPSSLFPLEFKIDPVNNSLTPDNDYSSVQDLPVRSGLDANGYPTYWFEKTMTWAEYSGVDMVDGIKTFPVYFSTIVANSATVVNVSQEYFTSG